MRLEMIVLALAALACGIASGAIHELVGKHWAVAWGLLMVWLLVALAIL